MVPIWRELLVCPVDHAALDDCDGALCCTRCGRRYPIEDGLPNMIPEDADADGE